MVNSGKMEVIAGEIFSQVRTAIVLNMRFLDVAVFRLKTVPETVSFATDGERLYYNPFWLLKCYRKESNAPTRNYMHVLMHCIFRHPFVNTQINQKLWDIACDIAAEGLICELNQSILSTALETKRKAVVDGLREHVRPFTAEKLYAYFQSHEPYEDWGDLFHVDEHAVWYSRALALQMALRAETRNHRSPQEQSGDGERNKRQLDDVSSENNAKNSSNESQQTKTGVQQKVSQMEAGEKHSGKSDSSGSEEGGSASQSAQSDEQQNPPQSEGGDHDKKQSDNTDSSNDTGGQRGTSQQEQNGSEQQEGYQSETSARQALEDDWRDISEHVKINLETFAKQQGLQAGNFQQMLAELNRERYDYEAFLKKFAVMGEIMKINDDEFDYIFYTYGLKLFKNMPLIEPLEYKDVKRIREFIIAIDTSGSTSGELVQRFLNKTYNILMSTESFFSKVNIHIIQCDAEIQEVVKVTNRDEFEQYLRSMTILGLGGTDFRPVFSYVDQLIQQHEFRNLKGVIYFTDGCGTFPGHKPDYTTAFVFVQDEYNNLDVPSWAIKLILEKDEV